MSDQATTPAIRGVAQLMQRCDDPREALAPLDMIERALRSAAEDAGAPSLLQALDCVIVPASLWGSAAGGAPAKELAKRVGSPDATPGTSIISGTSILETLDWACREIAAGRREIVAIAAGECEHSKRRAAKQGIDLGHAELEASEPAFTVGGDHPHNVLEQEIKVGIVSAPAGFALCENSLRRARGEGVSEHRERIAGLWSQLSSVAANNPAAWIQRRVPAEEIATPSESNRVVAWPYTKLMVANMVVDQASALIITSEAAAKRHGVRAGASIYPHASAASGHALSLSERPQLHEHPGQVLATQRALEHSGIAANDLSAIDLYSCFPFAIQSGAAPLSIDPQTGEPPLTVTGGLTFGGGPLNNYTLQALAAIAERMREQPGHGLVTGIGGFFAKFAATVFGNEPPASGAPVSIDVDEEAAKQIETRAYSADYQGPVEIETCTAVAEPGGTHFTIFATLTDDGTRVWARSNDDAIAQALIAGEELCGRPARIGAETIELG